MNKNIVLCGVGGQGTVLASKMIAAAAMKKGLHVMSAETIGMAQRGGNVFSNVRIGDEIYAPMIGRGEADLIIGFEPGETVRMFPYLKKGGSVVTNINPVKPTTATLSKSGYSGTEMVEYLKSQVASENLILIDGNKATEELGNSKVLNVVLLGAAIRTGDVGLSEEDVLSVFDEMIKEKLRPLNRQAFVYTKQED